jgi:CRP/FNR family transcriptional regulator, cyclic AMP receptor protein
VSLLDAHSELREAIDMADRNRASRALLAGGYRFTAGPVDIAAAGWPYTTFTLLLLHGSLVHETRAATGRMIAFLSHGDVLMPFGPDPHRLPAQTKLTATEDVLVAALDQRFMRAAAVWPQLMIVIQRRLAAQQHRLAVHGAICQLPRVEQRLIALMWHLADRFGKVTRDGIVITHPLNHQTLADLVGARRPTVSLALKALRERDQLLRHADRTWLLRHSSVANGSLDDLIDQLTPSATPQPLAVP